MTDQARNNTKDAVHSKDLSPLPASIVGPFIRNQFFTTIPIPTATTYPDITGKCAIITGSNTGLGLESARQLISLGIVSHLVMGVRSLDRGQAAADQLIQSCPDRKKITIDVWHLDMESYDSILSFVQKCKTDISQRIDIAILNAGLQHTSFSTLSSTGHEPTVQVNHISTSLLAILLLPLLAKGVKENAPPARLSIVNSLTAHACEFPMQAERPLLQAFDKPKNFVGDRYGMSKMLNQLFIARLAARFVDPTRVLITMVDPGLTRGTGLFRNVTDSSALMLLLKVVMRIVGRPVQNGAATYLDAVLGDYGAGSHGSLLLNCKVAPYSRWLYSDAAGTGGYTDAIWDETMEELRFAGVHEILKTTGTK